MEARFLRAVALTAVLSSLGANYRTTNFIVSTSTPELAEEIGKSAEKFRKELAIQWLGKEMRNWAQPCPITAQVAENLGAGGATSFLFERGEVYGWKMTIQGSRERILDSVLPHEVTHTVFATYFRQPLPRWADEGACTTVEHASERAKQQNMLIDFLRTGRGIAFSRMFAMKEYPQDVMPLYSQGYSLARYLIANGGRQKFLAFVKDGLQDENWTRAIQEHYGYKSLGNLQNTWLAWVKQGSPAIDQPSAPAKTPDALAMNQPRTRPEPNLIYRGQSEEVATESVDSASDDVGPAEINDEVIQLADDRSNAGRRTDASLKWRDSKENAGPALVARTKSVYESDRAEAHEVTRPQPPEKPRQIILEWNRPAPDHPGMEPAHAAVGTKSRVRSCSSDLRRQLNDSSPAASAVGLAF
jgi:hypothetical protein